MKSAWLTDSTGNATTQHFAGKGGKASYARLFGKPAREVALEFG